MNEAARPVPNFFEEATRAPHALRASAETNITPLIDVLFVLLVILLAALSITDGMRRTAEIR